MSYYKYKDRENPRQSTIDWASLTGAISEGINAERDRRRDLKAELDQTQLNNLNTLEDFSVGLDPTRNQQIQNMASQYKDYLYEQNELLKNGQITPTDYKLSMQGAMDTFTNINEANKIYNEKIAELAEAEGGINDAIFNKVADLSNIEGKQLVIDPVTGSGTLAKLDEAGNIIPESMIPAVRMQELLQSQVPEYDYSEAVSNAVEQAGTWTEADSPYKSVEDLRQNPEYTQWKEAKVDAIMAESMDGKLIADYAMGMEVTDNLEEAQANPDKYLYMKNNAGRFEIEYVNDAQKQKVRDLIENQIEIGVGRKITRKAPSQAALKSGRERRSQEGKYNLIIEAAGGNESAMQTLAAEEGFTSVSIEDGKLYLSKGDTDYNPIDLNETVANFGQVLAGTLGIDGRAFDAWYQDEGDVVNMEAVSQFSPYAVTETPDVKFDEKTYNSISQSVTKSKDAIGGFEEIPNAMKIQMARDRGLSALAAAGVDGVTIDKDGEVKYQNESMGNVIDGPQWLRRIQDKVNKTGSQSTAKVNWVN